MSKKLRIREKKNFSKFCYFLLYLIFILLFINIKYYIL